MTERKGRKPRCALALNRLPHPASGRSSLCEMALNKDHTALDSCYPSPSEATDNPCLRPRWSASGPRLSSSNIKPQQYSSTLAACGLQVSACHLLRRARARGRIGCPPCRSKGRHRYRINPTQSLRRIASAVLDPSGAGGPSVIGRQSKVWAMSWARACRICRRVSASGPTPSRAPNSACAANRL